MRKWFTDGDLPKLSPTAKETPMPDTPDVHILSKSYYRALADYPCSWADDGHSIKKGRRYVRVVVKPEGGEFQTQKVCLDCWVKP